MELNSFTPPAEAIIIGANGGIGQAFCRHLLASPQFGRVHAISRSGTAAINDEQLSPIGYDPANEASIEAACVPLTKAPVRLIISTIGTLHDETRGPEKALRDLDGERFLSVMRTNAVLPALFAKHLMPLMKGSSRVVLAALSARVGSISDNRLGGWHAYRASKAALNQLYRNVALEVGRRNDHGVVVTLHPGTVETTLSEPFRRNVPDAKLFTPDYAAGELLKTLDGLTPADSGRCFDYAGKEVPS